MLKVDANNTTAFIGEQVTSENINDISNRVVQFLSDHNYITEAGSETNPFELELTGAEQTPQTRSITGLSTYAGSTNPIMVTITTGNDIEIEIIPGMRVITIDDNTMLFDLGTPEERKYYHGLLPAKTTCVQRATARYRAYIVVN
jgi:hypothetical protein